MNRVRNIYFLFLYGIGITIFQSCQHAPRNIPFPVQETEYSQPVSSPFKFSEGWKIKWENAKPDSTKPFKEIKIDFEKLPSKPFDLGDFRPMSKPMEETKFDLDNLPDTLLDIDRVPAKKIKFKVSLLGQPIRTKALRPRIRDKATQSIFEYGPDQGLNTGGGIGNMFQDSRGFLWISTSNGLYRFDGENFDLYTAAQGLNSFNNIGVISEDSKGQIWVGNDKGIDIINLEDGTLKYLGSSQVLSSNDIRDLMPDKLGNMWVCTEKGIGIIDPTNTSLKNLSEAQGLGKNFLTNLLEDDDGNIWIGAVGEIFIIEKSKNLLKSLTNAGDLSNRIYKDIKGRILIRNSGGSVDIVDLKGGSLKKLGIKQGLNSNKIFRLASDNLGQLWLSSATGIDIVNLDNNQIRNLGAAEGLTKMGLLLKDNQGHMWMNDGYAEIDFTDLNGRMFKRQSSQGVGNGAVRTLYEDNYGRIWIANSTETFYIADPKARTVKHIDSSNGMKLIPSGFLEVEKDQIWISSYYGGVYIYELKTGILNFLPVPNNINAGVTSSFFKDKKGDIWIWGEGGITVYDPLNKTFRNLVKEAAGNHIVNSCMEDEKGNIWIASENGVDILDPGLGIMKHLMIEKEQALNQAFGFMTGEKGKVLFLVYGYGVFALDPANGTLIKFTTKEGLASDQVTSIVEKNENIYVGTSEGLTIINPNDQGPDSSQWMIKNYGRPQLFNHVDFNPTAISTKKNQFWWGLGADGILMMEEHGNDTIVPPTYISGIDIMEQRQYFSNKMLLPSKPGAPDTIWSMYRDTFYLKEKLPADTGYLQTNHIHWNNTTGPFNIPLNLSLPYNQNYIRFHFTGTHFGNTDKTRYRYILEGQDNNWSNITDQSFASYISLKPGKFNFKVTSRGFNGLWSNPVEMSFTITPPWWRTWWAYILFVVLGGIIVWGGIAVYRSNQVRAENLRLEGKVMQRTKELKLSLEELRETQTLLIQQEKMASLGELTAGIAHEIQNPLNFVNNFSELNTELIDDMERELNKGNIDYAKTIAKDVKENEQKINHHGKRADAIVKGMLQHSRVTAGLKEPTDINNLADEYLRLAYHGLRAKDKSFNVVLHTQFDDKIGKVNIVAQDIGRVLLNLYNNAFYATAEKKNQQPVGYEPSVSVSTKRADDKIEITVKDNGNGIPRRVLDKIFQPFFTTKPTGQGTGLGLSLSYDIIKAHGGEFKVDTKEGEGAEFLIQIPKG
jgi:signal transduction histidine kinase/ligand-binding sensor domain-containing protein